MSSVNLKSLVTKTVSLTLIFFGLYQTFLSLNAIFFVYPNLKFGLSRSALIIQEGLVEKALLLYVTMVTNGVYGVVLLLKPTREVEIIHILLGIIIAIVSLFFITKTPFTSDPIFDPILKLMGF